MPPRLSILHRVRRVIEAAIRSVAGTQDAMVDRVDIEVRNDACRVIANAVREANAAHWDFCEAAGKGCYRRAELIARLHTVEERIDAIESALNEHRSVLTESEIFDAEQCISHKRIMVVAAYRAVAQQGTKTGAMS